MIRITDSISIDDAELDEQFIRASGPGGQNVNKVASAVELRFDARASPSLPASVKARLTRLAGSRMTKDGVIVIRADRFRSQEQNRADARERLAELVIAAAHVPKRRIKTKPTFGSKERRLAGKALRSKVKGLRGKKPSFD
jgi:ribosome-associated protein